MFLRDTGVEDSVLLPEDAAGSGVTLRATDVDEPFPRFEDAEEDEVRRLSVEDAEEDDDGRRTLEVVVLSAVGGFCEEVTAEVLRVVCDVEDEDEVLRPDGRDGCAAVEELLLDDWDACDAVEERRLDDWDVCDTEEELRLDDCDVCDVRVEDEDALLRRDVCDVRVEDEDVPLLRLDVCDVDVRAVDVWAVDEDDEEEVRRLCASEPVWETARTAIIAAIAFIYAFIIKIFQETGMLRESPWLNIFSAYGKTVHLQ